MPASKRRLADQRKAAAARAPEAIEVAAEPAVVAETPPEKATGKSARAPRQKYVETDPAYVMWPRPALMALLALVFAVQVAFGLIQHVGWHRSRLIWTDLFFANSFLLLGATVVLAPVLKYLLKLPRHLRWLESLSLGAVYALVVTLLTLTLIHTPVLPKNATADDLMNALGNGDVPGMIIADTFGILFAAQIFPGLSRMITAPGRKAKARLEEKNRLAKKNKAGGAGGRTATRPARSARSSASRTASKDRR